MTSIWATLGITATRDRDLIRRAYAKKLRTTNPEDDPAGFMALRQAYEAALARVAARAEDLATAWDVDPETPPSRDAPAEAPSTPRPPPPPAPIDPRLAEQADLAARRDALLAALGAPEPPSAAALVNHLEALLDAPALEAIGVRRDLETWVAEVIADNLPRADPLVAPAMMAFGWHHDSMQRWSPAVTAVLQRHDEAAFVAAAARPHAPLHLGWLALTTPGRPAWRHRIDALLPGNPGEVATILANADGPLPGIRDWFAPAAEAWWRRWLERERVTGGLLVLPFIALLLALALPAVPAIALITAALAAPVAIVRFVKQPQRDWAERPWEHPDWHFQGWMPALPALPLLAALLPAGAAGTAATALAALLVLGWTIIATPREAPVPFWHRIGSLIRIGWPFALFGMNLAKALPAWRAIAWSIVAATFAIAWSRGGDAITERVRSALDSHPARWPARAAPSALAIAALLPVALTMAITAALPPPERLYTGLLAVLVAMLTLFLAYRLVLPGAKLLPVYAGWLILVVMAVTLVAITEPPRPRTQAATLAPIVNCPTDDRAARQPGIAFIAIPCQPELWITTDDYPAAAARLGATGTTGFRLEIDPRGRVAACTVTQPSGNADLDTTTYSLVRQRARFLPALDAAGAPERGIYFSRIVWQLADR